MSACIENNLNPNIVNSAALVGRILLALIFITSGFGKITEFDGIAGYIASKGLPLPQLATIIAIAVELHPHASETIRLRSSSFFLEGE